MKKRIYNQPAVATSVMPKSALMGFQGSPGDEFNPTPTPAPERKDRAF